MPILPITIKFGLVPAGDIEIQAASQGRLAWKFTGKDPHVLLNPTKPMLPGMYKLELVKAAFEPDSLNGKLYFDTGNGFSESEAVDLHFSSEKATAHFETGRMVHCLRLDPHDAHGTLSAKAIRLTRISTTLHRATRVTQAAAERVESVDDAFRLLTKSYNVLRRDGVVGLRHAISRSLNPVALGPTGTGYTEWVQRYDTFGPAQVEELRKLSKQLAQSPLISVIMPVYNAPVEFLREAIESVKAQAYPNWELCIADDRSTDDRVIGILNECALEDDRIKVIFREKNGHISAASNSALSLAKGDWVALLDQDDILPPNALYEVACAANKWPEAKMMYSDEDKLSPRGARIDPYFKSDWNYNLFLSHNMFSHLGVYKANLVHDVGGFTVGMEGSQDYDLALRCVEAVDPKQIIHIPKILYHWRQLPGSTSVGGDEKPYAMVAGERALDAHLKRQGRSAKCTLEATGYSVRYDTKFADACVDVIVPTSGNGRILKNFVGSVVGGDRGLVRKFIIIDNGAVDAETNEIYSDLEKDKSVSLFRYEGEFNYSSINNFGYSKSDARYLLLANDDIQARTEGWLASMVGILDQQTDVGIVGTRLLYPNGLLQHAGIVLGLGGVAGHAHYKIPGNNAGYFGRAKLQQEFSAVTAACLLVRRSVYQQIGGFDDVSLPIAYNDVDFCLKARERGWKVVLSGSSELIHHESLSRGLDVDPVRLARLKAEQQVMLDRWGDVLTNDPYYNPNLSLDHAEFSLAFPPRLPGSGIYDARMPVPKT